MAGLASYSRIISAGKTERISVRGMLVVLRQAAGEIRIHQRQNQLGDKGAHYHVVLTKGQKWYAAEEFDGIDVENPEEADQTVELLIGYGDYQEPPPDLSVADIFKSSDTGQELDNTAAVLLVAENPQRSKISIKFTTGDPATRIYLGGTQAQAQAEFGIPFEDGDTYAGNARGEIWAYASVAPETTGAHAYYIEEEFSAPAL